MSGYDWEPEHYDAAERAREWDRADDRERWERKVRDRVTRDVGEMTERGLPGECSSVSGQPRSVISPTMHEGEA